MGRVTFQSLLFGRYYLDLRVFLRAPAFVRIVRLTLVPTFDATFAVFLPVPTANSLAPFTFATIMPSVDPIVWAAATSGSLLCFVALCDAARCKGLLCGVFFILFLL